MCDFLLYRFRLVMAICLVMAALSALPVEAQSPLSLHGQVVDPLGKPVSDATILLLQGDKEIVQGKSDADGTFALTVTTAGRYIPRVEATGFATQTLPPVSIESSNQEELMVSLRIGPLPQQIVVSATGTAIPEAQVGASITVIDGEEIKALDRLDVSENLQQVPGAQVVQTGQRGSVLSLFIRGGESDFNKILIDGVPVNDIGGAFDFAQIANNGVDSVEVLRGANSVLYGSDALSGVVNITSARGTTPLPEMQYSVDGGNFSTFHQDVSLSGLYRKFDYFSEFSLFDTQGSLPNDYFQNNTVSTNVGWEVDPTLSIRATFRHIATGLGSPNALSFYGIPDNSWQTNRNTYAGISLQHQTTKKWHNSVQFAYAQFGSNFVNPSPTGEPFDPFGFGPNYLGNVVTIKGANGYSVTGQAILDFGPPPPYPQSFPDYEARRSVHVQSDYQFFKDWVGVFGFRYEHENGDGFTRNNYSTFLEGHGTISHRFFTTFGVGLEHNSFFGFAATPRVSMAYYLRRPTNSGFLGETKLKFNFGTGIKEASTSQQANALISLLTPEQIAQFDVGPIGPERSRTFDFGLEQRLFGGRAVLGATFFYNNFYDLIAFLNPAALISIGVPPDAISSPNFFGAYVNATSERTKGAEVEYRMDLGHGFVVQGEYTYLDGVVTKAFGEPVFNPDFPTIPIGAFSPLVGARPFRRAPDSGSLSLFYSHNRFNASLNGYLVGRRDDSTSLEDGFFGNTMLLPNRDLAGAYQVFGLSASYAVTNYAKVYAVVGNLFSQHYEAVFGFPSLPFTFRSGVTFTIGGDHGWCKR
jgi:vitamin B12 transporter